MSQSNKEKYIAEEIKTIINDSNKELDKKEFKVIESLFKYKELFPKDYNEEKFVFAVSQRIKISNNDELITYIKYVYNSEPNLENFFKKVQ